MKAQSQILQQHNAIQTLSYCSSCQTKSLAIANTRAGCVADSILMATLTYHSIPV